MIWPALPRRRAVGPLRARILVHFATPASASKCVPQKYIHPYRGLLTSLSCTGLAARVGMATAGVALATPVTERVSGCGLPRHRHGLISFAE